MDKNSGKNEVQPGNHGRRSYRARSVSQPSAGPSRITESNQNAELLAYLAASNRRSTQSGAQSMYEGDFAQSVLALQEAYQTFPPFPPQGYTNVRDYPPEASHHHIPQQHLSFAPFSPQDVPLFNHNPGQAQAYQESNSPDGIQYPFRQSEHQMHHSIQYPFAPRAPGSQSVPNSAGNSPAGSVSSPDADQPENERQLLTEDKRRRNTAASARFRIRKKERNVNLERSVSDLTSRANELEREVDELRRENGWLKEIVMLKGSRIGRDEPQKRLDSTDDDTEPVKLKRAEQTRAKEKGKRG